MSVSDKGPVFVIAEAGSNWRMGSRPRDIRMANALVEVAAEAGADAVKFQTYRSVDTYAVDAGASSYLSKIDEGGSINEIFRELEMPYEMIGEIATLCSDAGIEFMSTPFSIADAAAVDPYVKRHKVASYEINHVRLLQALGALGKPLIMSSGAATEEDIAFGLAAARGAGATDITLLQCTASYPAPIDAMNVSVLPRLREMFGVNVGLSDHSRDPIVAPVSAVALGARVIEKHFTLNNRLPGPDHKFALEPHELRAMVQSVRLAEQARGSGVKVVADEERELRQFAVRAVQATRAIAAGEAMVEGGNVAILRPGNRRVGMHPRHLRAIEGRVAVRDIEAGDGIVEEDLAPLT
jgi:sialic acid synthase SpsE